MRRRYTAVILDRDGVLATFDFAKISSYFDHLLPISLTTLIEVWIDWAQGREDPRNIIEEHKYLQEFWDHICSMYEIDRSIEIRLRQFEYTQFMSLYPEVPQTLLELRDRGVQLGVLSNFGLASLDKSLEALGIAHYFTAAIAAPVINSYKPAPASYMAAANALGIDSHNILFVDDELDCVEGARKVGFSAVLMDRKGKRESHCIQTIDDLSAILELL